MQRLSASLAEAARIVSGGDDHQIPKEKLKKFKRKRLYPGMYFGDGVFTSRKHGKVFVVARVARLDYHNKKSRWYLELEANRKLEDGMFLRRIFVRDDGDFSSYGEAKKYFDYLMKTEV